MTLSTVATIDDKTRQEVVEHAKRHVISQVLNASGFLDAGEKKKLVQEALTIAVSVYLERGKSFSNNANIEYQQFCIASKQSHKVWLN